MVKNPLLCLYTDPVAINSNRLLVTAATDCRNQVIGDNKWGPATVSIQSTLKDVLIQSQFKSVTVLLIIQCHKGTFLLQTIQRA